MKISDRLKSDQESLLFEELAKINILPLPKPSDYVPIFVMMHDLVPKSPCEIMLLAADDLYDLFRKFLTRYSIHEADPKKFAYRFGRWGVRSTQTPDHKTFFIVNPNFLES